VDYDTQRRRAKRSAGVYSQIMRANALAELDVVLAEAAGARTGRSS
jgi:hypothetical protein